MIYHFSYFYSLFNTNLFKVIPNQKIKEMFDIVIPVDKKDLDILEKQLYYVRLNVINYRRIYLITNADFDLFKNMSFTNDCILIPEFIFPFTIKTIENIRGINDRNGWYLQQLLKLYAGLVIPEILERYLIIDADTFFFKPITFIENDKCLYNYEEVPILDCYYNCLLELDISFQKNKLQISGITHHMLFETSIIKEIFTKIEKNNFNKPFYLVILDLINKIPNNFAGFSEYELYFNYIYNNHKNKIILRKLNFCNVQDLINLDVMKDYDYVSLHKWYLDKPENHEKKKIIYENL